MDDRDGDAGGKAAPPRPDPSAIRDAALFGAADRAARLPPAGLAGPTSTSSRMRLSRRGGAVPSRRAFSAHRRTPVGHAGSELRLTVMGQVDPHLRLRAAGCALPGTDIVAVGKVFAGLDRQPVETQPTAHRGERTTAATRCGRARSAIRTAVADFESAGCFLGCERNPTIAATPAPGDVRALFHLDQSAP